MCYSTIYNYAACGGNQDGHGKGVPTAPCKNPNCKPIIEDVKGLCPECVKSPLSDKSTSKGKYETKATQTANGIPAKEKNGAATTTDPVREATQGKRVTDKKKDEKKKAKAKRPGFWDSVANGYCYSSPGYGECMRDPEPSPSIAQATLLQPPKSNIENTQGTLRGSITTPLLSGDGSIERSNDHGTTSIGAAETTAEPKKVEKDTKDGVKMKRRQKFVRWVIGGLTKVVCAFKN
ncbi:hypothetical protein ABW21_db0209008 [Orbilia brochopaga]|nr:hypothetical protein ABW21_db0209008 [Drechslerella brochopaga]